MSNPRPNPYVGPRSFRTGEKIYGRERETLELLDLLIAERIVLLYSPSGAGKTSLIQAALVPSLRAEGFNVLPPVRVNAEPPSVPPPPGAKRGAAPPAPNRFVLSALLSLEEKLPPDKRLPLPQLARLSLNDYLQQRHDLADANTVLVFDQFEEILTLEPTQLDAKQEFFDQLGVALRDRARWALLSMREDYLAGLDPYRRPVPTRLNTTFRLDLLGVSAAREAIQKPAQNAGVTFTDAAANKLVDDLRRVQVQRPDGTTELQPGPYVEPVQLQVVCYRLWDKLDAAKTQIVESDIAAVGDVSTALADYYDVTVKNVAAASGETERAVREWFERQLITEQGIRGQVLMEPERSRGLSNRAIRLLEDAHLVRADERRGATWFELAHDRLIEPVRASNAAWFHANLSALQQQAELWNERGRQDGLLLRGEPLLEAEKWAQQHSGELTPTEQEFLAESQQARAVRQREQRQNRRIRFLAIGASILSVIALAGICISLFTLNQLGEALTAADTARATAVANEQDANRQRQIAVSQDRVSKMTSVALSQLSVDPEISLLLATEAYSTTQNIQTDDALRQAVAESHLRGTLTGHTGGVNAVAFSADGKFLLTGSGDTTARVWDASNGQVVHELTGHTAPIWAAAFRPDGQAVVTGAEDGAARVWDLSACTASGCPSRKLKGHTKTIYGAAYSPDGKWIVTGSEDGTAIVWDAETGAILHTLRGHASAINGVAFSPTGQEIATASSDHTVRIWDLTACTGADCPFKEWAGQSEVVWSVAFSPDGNYFVAASNDQNAYRVDVASGSVTNVLSGHNDVVYSVAYSPNGELIATGSQDGSARLWDADTGLLVGVLRGHQDYINSLAFSPDSHLVLTGSADGTARLWTANTGPEVKVLRGHFNKVFDARYSADGKRVITASVDKTARVWDAETGELIMPLQEDTWVLSVALNRDGTLAATGLDDGYVELWHLDQCSPNAEGVQQCAVDDLVGHTAGVRSLEFSPDGTSLVSASDDGTARIWRLDDVAHPVALDPQAGALYHAAYSPDGKTIVTAGADAVIRLWDAATGQAKPPELRGHEKGVNSAVFNADGTLILSASDDRTARVWDAATGQEQYKLEGHTSPVTGAVFSKDGKFIVTASSDKTARIWDTATRQQTSVIRGHTDKIQTVELSLDDQFVLTASSDKTARITLVSIAEFFKLARARATRALSCDEWKAVLQEAYCPEAPAQNANVAFPTSAPVTAVAIADLPTTLPASPTEVNAPTAIPTAEATARPTVDLSLPSGGGGSITTPSPTEPPAATAPPSPLPLPTAPPTPTAALEPGIYITQLAYVPLDAPNFKFKVSFLNTTGQPFNTRWLVPFYEQGVKNSIGAPKGVERTIPVGASQMETEVWKVGVGQCTTYTGIPVWQDEDGRQTPFRAANRQDASVSFQLCP